MTKEPPAQSVAVYSVPTLSEVYELHFRYVWRCVRSLGVAPANVDDAVQEVFLVVQRRLGSFDGGCELRTWLYAIVVRIVRRHRAEAARAAQRRAISAGNEARSIDASADLRCEVEANEQLALASRALNQLDDIKREVFVFACIEGMSAPEIAAVTGAPLNTVYSRIRAAKQQFDQAVAILSEPRSASRIPQ